jgi:hypothetical protein
MLNFKGAAAKRSPDAIARAAALIGCNIPALEAVIMVEAAANGFDSEGRPKALFEPHIFYRHLTKLGDKSLLMRAERAGLAYPKWGTQPYPRDSYPRIEAACAIDEDFALQSTSWGLPQILGENYGAAGYSSAKEMVLAFMTGEDEQIAAMARFISVNRGMADALERLDWRVFKDDYNGPGSDAYVANLERAYRQACGLMAQMPEPKSPASLNKQIAGQHSAKVIAHSTAAMTIALSASALPAAAPHASHWWEIALAGTAIVGATLFFGLQALGHAKSAAQFSAAMKDV